MAEIQAGVLLSLKDKFSSGIRQAGSEVSSFGKSASLAMDKLDKATSGIGAKVAGFGLTLGAGAAVNQIIEYTDRINRLGTNMNLSRAETEKMKRAIVSVAGDHNIKINPEGLTSAVEQIGELTGDAKFAQENLRTLGLVMQATGASGESIGGMAAELQKMKLAPGEVAQAMGTLAAQGKAGAFTIKNFAEMGPRLYSAYAAAGRTGVAASAELGAVMQVIRQGTGTSEQAGTAFEAMMRNLTDPVKQKMLRQMGVNVRDQAGNFRSVTELIPEIVSKGKSLEQLGTVFDSEAIRAFNSSLAEFQKTGAVKGIEQFTGIVGGLPDIEADAARNASSLKSNISNLQTSFSKFADSNLTKPLGALADILNSLAEKPLEVKKAFTIMSVAIGAVAAVKGFSAVKGLVNDFKGLNAGGTGGASGLSKGNGGATPVMVTNWPAGGGLGGAGEIPQPGVDGGPESSPSVSGKGGRLSRMRSAAVSGLKVGGAWAAVTAGIGIVTAMSDSEASSNEKAKAIGNSVGSAAGGVVGAAIGAGLGSIVPGIGTAIGGVVGGMLGAWLGGMGGEKMGNAIDNSLSGRDRASATQIAGYSTSGSDSGSSQLGKSQLAPASGLSGTIKSVVDLNLSGDRPSATVRTTSNLPGFVPETGSSRVARGL